ncbi:MAG TPA: tetratricopeptide repeat protein [Thermoanaerobaculia bacterium]|nr:tetratricopeptide repeat protein [Thermoanaerobaculia bacterium]
MSDFDSTEAMRRGIQAVRQEEYLLGLSLLTDAYSSRRDVPPPDGLSYYAVCVALVQKKFKPAVDLCKKAIELQFYHPEHYANLARVYMAAENRKKALATVEQGLKVMPEDESLLKLRGELGLRRKPPIPFLPRNNALNVMLGRARHAKQVDAAGKKKSPPRERE